MKKTNDHAIMKFVSYGSPEIRVLDIISEGVLCSSTFGSSADDLTCGDQLQDYEQIY